MAGPTAKHRTVFIDRDGTIARDVPYCSRPEDFHLFPGVTEAIGKLNRAGYLVVVITNQSGIARGYFDEAMLRRIHAKMVTDLKQGDARLDGIYYCPHHPDAGCECRKPKPTMFHHAAVDLGINLGESYMVGDMSQDIEAGIAAGCRTVFVLHGSQRAGEPLKAAPHHTADSFADAVAWILAQG